MPIALRGTPQSVTNTSGFSGNVNKPAGVIPGDLIMIAIAGFGTSGVNALNTPSGFTPYTEGLSSTGVADIRKGWFYRIATGSEGASFAVSNNGPTSYLDAECIAFSGVNRTNPFLIAGVATAGGGATLTSADLGATTVDGAWHLLSFGTYDNGLTGNISGYTKDLDYDTTQQIWHKVINPAGATGAQSLTNGGTDGWVALAVALNPEVPVGAAMGLSGFLHPIKFTPGSSAGSKWGGLLLALYTREGYAAPVMTATLPPTVDSAGTPKAISRVQAAILSFVGTLTKQGVPFRLAAATLSSIGTLTKQPQKLLASLLYFVLTVFDPNIFDPAIFGAAGPTLYMQTRRAVSGVLSFSGARTATWLKSLAATLSSIGTLTNKTQRLLAGILYFDLTLFDPDIFDPAIFGFGTTMLFKQTRRALAGRLFFSPAVMSVTNTAFGSATTSHAVNMPAATRSRDLLVVMFANSATATVTTPTGWTLLDSVAQTGVRPSLYVRWADGTEGGTTVDFVTSVAKQAAAQVYQIAGASGYNWSGFATGVSSGPNAGNLITGWETGRNVYLTFFAENDDFGITTVPTNYYNSSVVASAAGAANTVVSVGSALLTSDADAEDSGAWTLGGSVNWAATTFGVRPLTASYATEVRADSPVAYWRMNDRGSLVTMVADVGTNGAYGNAPTGDQEPAVADGDRAVLFNGTNQYATSTGNLDLSATNKVTVEFLLNWAAFANDDDLAFEHSPTTASNIGFYADPNQSDGKFGVSMSDGAGGFNSISFTRPGAASWHHYLFEFDRSAVAAQQVRAWVDGVEQTFTKPSNTLMTGNFASKVLYIMSRGGTTLFGNGTLDELAVYPTLLPPARIAAHVAAISPKYLTKRTNKALSAILSFLGNVATFFTAGGIHVDLFATLSFVGTIPSRNIGKALPATLSFVGTVTRFISNTRGSTLSFIGTATKRTSRSLSGLLSFIGTLTNRTGKALAGTLSFVGTIPTRAIVHQLAATLSFVGTVTRLMTRALSGTLSFVGNTFKQTQRLLGSVLSFVGPTTKTTTHALAGTLSFVGTITKRAVTRTLTGTLSFVGSVARLIAVTRGSTLSFIGTVTKQTSRSLSGVLSFVGTTTMSKTFLRTLPGTLSFVGTITKRDVTRTLTGTLSFVGSVTRFISVTRGATLSFIGSTFKQTQRLLSGVLSFIGTTTMSKTFLRTLPGTLSFVGTITRRDITRTLTGTLSFVGIITRFITAVRGSTLSFIGTTTKRTSRSLSGLVSFVGTTTKTAQRALAGTLSFVGTVAKRGGKALGGVIAYIGTIVRRDNSTQASTLSFVGTTLKQTRRTLTGLLSFVGTTAAAHLFVWALAGTLAFSGNTTKQTRKALAGTLSFVGNVVRQTRKVLGAVLSFSGTALRRMPYHLSAALSFGGSVFKQTRRTLTVATLALLGFFNGSRNNQFFRTFTATASFSGNLSGGIARRIARAMTLYLSWMLGDTYVARTHRATDEQVTSLLGQTSVSGSLRGQTEVVSALIGVTVYERV